MPPSIDAAQRHQDFLDVDRAELYRRIDARFDAMLASGALDEVRALAARRLDPSLPAMKAHGVPWLIRHLTGEITLAEAAEGGKRDTRRYTKRQAHLVPASVAGLGMGDAGGGGADCRSTHSLALSGAAQSYTVSR